MQMSTFFLFDVSVGFFYLLFMTQRYGHQANKCDSQESIQGFLIIGFSHYLQTASLSLNLRIRAAAQI